MKSLVKELQVLMVYNLIVKIVSMSWIWRGKQRRK